MWTNQTATPSVDGSEKLLETAIPENNTFERTIDQVKKDIATNTFIDKSAYYMDLMKVDREEFDDYLIFEFDGSELDDSDFDAALFFDMDVKVNEVKVFERLFCLYYQDNAFLIPPKPNYHLKEYLTRLDKDCRYFSKKQLTIWGNNGKIN